MNAYGRAEGMNEGRKDRIKFKNDSPFANIKENMNMRDRSTK